jgi:5'-3' exonuclease
MVIWPKPRPAGPHYAQKPCTIPQRYHTRTTVFTTFCAKQTAPSSPLVSPDSSFDILILDATNIFFHSKADLQRWDFALKKTERYKHGFISSQFNAYIDYYCSIVGTSNVIAVFDPSSLSSQRSNNKQPRRKTSLLDTLTEDKKLDQNLNSLVIMTSSTTADCAIASTCALLSEDLPAAKVVVATADSDLLQVCNPNTTILYIHPYPSKSHPYSVEFVTNDKFEKQYGFPPSLWGEYVALGGFGGDGKRKKKKKGIKGVGVSRDSARKLLQHFGSLKGIERAGERGKLKGWESPVQLLFDGNGSSDDSEKARSLLQQNLKNTVLKSKGTAALSDKEKQSIYTFASNIKSSTIVTNQQIDIWKHPLHAARWNMLSAHQLTETLATQLQLTDPVVIVDIKCTTTSNKNAVDMIITRASKKQGEATDGSNKNKKKTIGVMICTYADFKDEDAAKQAHTTWNSIIEASSSANGSNNNNRNNTNKWLLEGTDQSIAESTRKLKRYLNTWASIHLSLLEQDDSLSVMACVPFMTL